MANMALLHHIGRLEKITLVHPDGSNDNVQTVQIVVGLPGWQFYHLPGCAPSHPVYYAQSPAEKDEKEGS